MTQVPDISKSELESTIKNFIGSLKAASSDFVKKNRTSADNLRRTGSIDEANRTSDHRLQLVHGDTRKSVRRLKNQLKELGYAVCSSILSDAEPPSALLPNENLILDVITEHRPMEELGSVGSDPVTSLGNLSILIADRYDSDPVY